MFGLEVLDLCLWVSVGVPTWPLGSRETLGKYLTWLNLEGENVKGQPEQLTETLSQLSKILEKRRG